MFQDYALFPHMTVAENIEYGLRVRRIGKPERRERATRALDMVRLAGLGKRKPAQLSGGQRQRVALARAIVNEPQVLLLDEPLGALDLKLRQEMQLELLRVQREVGITFVYVTHDQEEALTMSDRIAVLNHGQIEQIGQPIEVYERPRTPFVAGFIGVSNLIERDGTRITVRPEKIVLLDDGQQPPSGGRVEAGRIRDVIYAGVLTRFVVDLDAGGELVVARQNAESPAHARDSRGNRVRIAWRDDQAFTISQGPGHDPGGRGKCTMTTPPRAVSRSIKTALLLAGVAVIAAGCGSSGGSQAAGSGNRDGDVGLTVPTAHLPVLQKIGKGEGQLNLIAWEGYLNPIWVKPFEQQTGCQVNAKYAGSSDEMVALMKNGGGGQYDMVSSSGDADLRILYAGDARPVNINLIPSWKDFFPAFQSPPFNTIDGVHYGVSLQWGPNVLMYNKKDFSTAADVMERHLQPEVQGPGDGTRQPDPDRRRGALPGEDQAVAGHHRSLRADPAPVPGGGEPAGQPAAADREVLEPGLAGDLRLQERQRDRRRGLAVPGQHAQGRPLPDRRHDPGPGRDRLGGHLDARGQGPAPQLRVHVDAVHQHAQGPGRAGDQLRRDAGQQARLRVHEPDAGGLVRPVPRQRADQLLPLHRAVEDAARHLRQRQARLRALRRSGWPRGTPRSSEPPDGFPGPARRWR